MSLEEDTSVVFKLQPKSYVYNSDPSSGRHIGYIAEEAASVHEKFAGYNEPGGTPVGIDYFSIVVFLVEEVRKLKEIVAELQATSSAPPPPPAPTITPMAFPRQPPPSRQPSPRPSPSPSLPSNRIKPSSSNRLQR
jgi:hypothetical protein